MREIGPYRVLRAPGDGGGDSAAAGGGGAGGARLCRAADGLLVTVEEPHPAPDRDAAARHRFARRARAARRIRGPWTVPVLDADPDAERPWLATAHVPAPDLAELLRATGPLPVATVRRLGADLAAALAAGHEAGLVHGGLEPRRVLVTVHGPRLTGFGLRTAPDAGRADRDADLAGPDADHTGPDADHTGPDADHGPFGHGPLGYESPEQIERPAEIGPPGDVFALGALLATAAQGRHPWTGRPRTGVAGTAGPGTAGAPGPEEVRAVRRRTTDGRPDLADVPGALLPALARCLDPDPALRPTPGQLLVLLGPDDRSAPWLPPAGLALAARYAADLPTPEQAGPVHLHPTVDRHPEALDLAARRAAAEQLPPGPARDAFAELLPVAEELYGSDHPDPLDLRFAHATRVGDTGAPGEAADLLAELAGHTARALGPDTPEAFRQRIALVHRTAETGDRAAALRQLDALREDTAARFGADHGRLAAIARTRSRVEERY
ncbi:hypothetical protein GCM10009759_78990 [Kitasatospora saccharophila]|uniref:Protein kinase domain-containing protein n=1 Tax=Kitasatospora saccharophila TaxID=407973 RepID=A0ABN2YFQ2_9ACTN